VLLPFFIVGAVGLIVLVISLVIGDVLDHLGLGDGGISGIALGIAATVFGTAGVLTTQSGLDIAWAYVAAICLAIGAYLIAAFVIRRLDATSDGVPINAVGQTGTSTSPISPAGGEVSLDGPAEIERRLAFSDEEIPEGQRIRVIEHSGTRVKVVAD
jgi:membrane-bound ClpP family serine protease